MSPNVVRQPLLLAFLSLLAIIIAALMQDSYAIPAPTAMISTPIGDLLQSFQEDHPRWSQIVAGILIFLSGILTGRLTVRYGLYPMNSSLAISLYGLVACGILLGRDCLVEFSAAFVLLLSVRSFFACFRNGYAIGDSFRASLFLGFLPLIYAPTLPLVVLILPAAICLRRTLREFFVSLCGVLLPLLVVCYIAWGLNYDPLAVPVQLWNAFLSDSGYHFFGDSHLLSPALVGITLFISLCAIFFTLASFRTLSIKAKGILLFTMILFVATAALAAAPSATPGLLAIIALPGAILMPLTFFRIHRLVGLFLYILLCVLCVANILLY